MRRWSNSIGEINKHKLLQIIVEHTYKGGLYQTEITEKSNSLSRQTVSKTLKKLIKENKIYCSNRKYYANEDVENYFSNELFAGYLEDHLRSLMTIKKLPKEGLVLTIGKITDNDLVEKNVFTFANMIGAFITYVINESKRPNQQNIDITRGEDN
jgi:DNA-binding transcriptional regulator LsrR (DeoR family)